MLDDGNGFVFDNGTRFGYPAGPYQLLESLGDNITEHSKIIGWAFDGNPIYGPYGYTDSKRRNGGIERAYSGYTLRSDRIGIKSNGG